MSFEGWEGDSTLQKNLQTLQEWVDKGFEMDSQKRVLVQSVATQLEEVENDESWALVWAYGRMLMAQLTKRKQDAAAVQKVLSIIMSSIESTRCTLLFENTLLMVGKLLITTKYFPSAHCAASIFLNKCFSTLNKELVPLNYSQVLQKIVLECSVLYILALVEDPNRKMVLHGILFTLFCQLINPACSNTKNVVKDIFATCDWKVRDTIREMLNDALLSGKVYLNQLSSFAFRGQVYQVILELLFIKKDLVVGLLNNTELCLAYEREDCLEGLEFFCNMFGTETPGILNPCEFFSHLWHEFLCQNDSLQVTQELLILAKHTSRMLSQSNTRGDWCELLFHFFEYEMPFECKKEFMLGITSSLQNSKLWLDDGSPRSLLSLIERLLAPESPIECAGKTRTSLLKNLGRVYEKASKVGVNDMKLQNVHNFCAKLLSCFLGTCSSLSATNKDWSQLRKLFVKNLVPHEEDAEVRMKMLLYMWLNCDSKKCSVLHELFSKTKCVRSKLSSIILILKDDNTARSKKHLLPKLFRELHLVSIKEVVYGTFLLKVFFPVVRRDLQFKKNLGTILSTDSSCTNNFKLIIKLKEPLMCIKDVDESIVDGFLYYVAEVQCDKTSMKHLMELVRQCLEGDEISTNLGRHRLHVARAALHLLNEVLFMLPHLGFDTEVLEYIFDWCKPSNGTLSTFALQCLTSMSSHKKLGDCNHELMGKVITLCLFIINNEPRGQVKMAMRCLAGHLSGHYDRDKVLREVLEIVSRHLHDPIDRESSERGVSALGHFSAICPPSLKQSVEDDCLSVLTFHSRIARDEQQSDISSNASSDNTWVNWEELPHNISVKVQALRSIGRCMHFCGSSAGVKKGLEALETVLSAPRDSFGNHREVDVDHLRCEAALALLFIFEAERFHSLISKSLLISLSKLLVYPRVEVRHLFAEKLCQGLSPYKVLSYANGHSRGKLPPCFLGLLVLLGSELWMNNHESKEKAMLMLREVFASRHITVVHKSFFNGVAVKQFYEKEPLCVLENILAIAVPILVENPFIDMDSFLEEPEKIEVLVSVTQCLKFICSTITHSSTHGGKVTKEYMKRLVSSAKQNLFPCTDANQLKKYSIVFELLSLVVKHYNTSVIDLFTPPIALPQPFFANDVQQNFMGCQDMLTVSCLNKIEKNVYFSKNEDTQFDESFAETSAEHSDFDSSMCSELFW